MIAVVGFVLVRLGAFRGDRVDPSGWRASVGLVLFGAGLSFAVLARIHIGRDWGSPRSQKEQPELVTTSPYRLARHPRRPRFDDDPCRSLVEPRSLRLYSHP